MNIWQGDRLGAGVGFRFGALLALEVTMVSVLRLVLVLKLDVLQGLGSST